MSRNYFISAVISFSRMFTILLLLGLRIPYASAQQALLDPEMQQQFVQQMPIPSVINATGGGTYTVSIDEFYQDLGLRDPVQGSVLMTKVWGYNGSYPGPTIVARRDVPVDFYWLNNLINSTGDPLAHFLPIDTSVHWALSGRPDWETSGVPVITHIHGGHTESASDGLPDQWYTPGFALKGPKFEKGETVPFHYDNSQEAATVWYHDHALGITRLNVYAGLAGFYLIRDNNEDALTTANHLPSGPYELGMAIQDRMFTADGQLYYPSTPEETDEEYEQPDPSVMPEFFGDFILVNGQIWPVLDVEPRPYRLRLLNGSDSRFYNLYFGNGVMFNQVGTDLGLLEAPVSISQLLIAPGERADVVVDFSDPALWGRTIILKNNARAPYPNGQMPNIKTTGQIMAFRVIQPLNSAYPVTTLPASLRTPIQPLIQTGATRKLILFEGEDEYDRLMPMLGTADEGVMMWDDAITENPGLNDVELWEVYNLTADAHPIHLHLVAFQIINRQRFKASVDATTAAISNIKLLGQPNLPQPREKGWKDTGIMYPGQVTRVIAKFDRAGEYVWHCHILSHEDHEMMRPYYVGTLPSLRLAESKEENNLLEQNYPNPFSDFTTIRFFLKNPDYVAIRLFDNTGREVKTLINGYSNAGLHSITIHRSELQPGIYYYTLVTDKHTLTKKMVVR